MGQQQGKELPFDVGEEFSCMTGKTIWSVHAGKRKIDNESVTVFMFDCSGKSEDEVRLARSAHLRLKTLRHPNILRYIDGIELPTSIYVVTEEAVPLEEHLDNTREGRSTFSLSWGLHQTIKAVGFLTSDCGLVHRNVCLSSVFVDSAGEWKLGGVEFMHPFGEASVNVPPKCLQWLHGHDPPETNKPSAARRAERWSCDMWGLGCLVWEVFNGTLTQVSNLRDTSKLPKSLIPHYCELVSANPKSRPSPSDLLNHLRERGGYLCNQFVNIALRVEELQIMEPSQRNDFFTELNSALDSFPKSFGRSKILPQLINAFEFGGAGSAVLTPLFRLGKLLDDGDYQRRIVPCVVKLFSSPDRATRINLLKQLEHFIDHLQPRTINDQIFPHIATGFSDTLPAIREQTIKSVILLVSKLSDSTKNTQLLKHLAKCQMDEEPGIRTNTTICLGKIASYLSPSTQQKVLVSAFLRPLKDPFPPARCAAIGGMMATRDCYTLSDIATRLLPALCTLTLDREKTVRDQVFLAVKMFLQKLEAVSCNPEVAEQQQRAESVATTWTGWAMSSLTSKFYRSTDQQQQKSTVAQPTTALSTAAQKEGSGQALPPDGRAPISAEREREEGRAVGRQGPSHGGEGGDWVEEEQSNDWEDDWEDATADPKEGGGGDSDMEGWADDGWGAFDGCSGGHNRAEEEEERREKERNEPTHIHSGWPSTSTGADFFDSFGGGGGGGRGSGSRSVSEGRRLKEPPQWRSGSSQPPPPVSASLFDSKPSPSPPPPPLPPPLSPPSQSPAPLDGGGSLEEKADGWDEWGDHDTAFEVTAVKSSQAPRGMKLQTHHSDPPKELQASQASEGWGWDSDSNWGTFETPTASGAASGSARQELMHKKSEERRLRQQAARDKRAAGMALKPSGLGATRNK